MRISPPEYREHIRYVCLILSEDYIRNHFGDIKAYASIIEQRLDDSYCTIDSLLADNRETLSLAREHHVNYILIDEEYAVDLTL